MSYKKYSLLTYHPSPLFGFNPAEARYGFKENKMNFFEKIASCFNPAEARYGFKGEIFLSPEIGLYRFNPAEARYGFKVVLKN